MSSPDQPPQDAAPPAPSQAAPPPADPPGKPPPDEQVPPHVGAHQQPCLSCMQTDNHPKVHVVTALPGGGEGPSVFHHYDCYGAVFANAEDPEMRRYAVEHCREVIDQASGAKGHALRTLMVGDEQGTAPAIHTTWQRKQNEEV